MRTLNKDVARRDTIIFGEALVWSDNHGEIEHFENLSAESLEALIKEGFADPEDAQNNSPTIKEFLDFLCKNPKFKATGYAVSPHRDDYRVSIEGVELWGEYTIKELRNFVNTFHYADEMSAEEEFLRCWYD